VISLVLGRREQGKSTLAYHLALKSDTRVIFDPRSQFHTSSDIISDDFDLLNLLDTRYEIIVQPEHSVPEVFERCAWSVNEWIKENPDEQLCFLLDEARFIETVKKIPPSLDAILRMAPRKTTHTIFTAHRPSDISVDIRAIADFWFLFHTTQEHDLKAIAERCGNDVADEVSTLKPFEIIVWDDGIGKARKDTNSSAWKHSFTLPARPEKFEGAQV
jgi:hypothetical protein